MKFHPVGVESFHADRRAGMTNLIVAFHNFLIAPNSGQRQNPSAEVCLLHQLYLNNVIDVTPITSIFSFSLVNYKHLIGY